MTKDRQYTFAYYCSGHGFGHATRVVALTHELLRRNHRVYICTNAPEHVFHSAVAAGAHYRHAEIDAGIVQPKAYDVARRKTIEGLRKFLDAREGKLDAEVSFLKRIQADAVLVDAPFLPCAAAARAGIPSVIISNFTFDSCYSYLSVSTWKDNSTASLARAMQGAQLNEATNTLQVPNGSSPTSPTSDDEEDEPPIPAEEIEPLVRQVTEDYANASLLLRLPGCIPIPAFDTDVPMPAEKWTNLEAHSFKGEIMDLLARDTEEIPACTCVSNGLASIKSNGDARRKRRKVINTPLIARPVAQDVYSKEKRRKILSGLGIPEDQHDAELTKILVVSFGGQSIPKPSASRPMTPLPPSRNGSISAEPGMTFSGTNGMNAQEHVQRRLNDLHISNGHAAEKSGRRTTDGRDDSADVQFAHMKPTLNGLGHASGTTTPLGKSGSHFGAVPPPPFVTLEAPPTSASLARSRTAAPRLQRLMTEDHIYLPGAPPALHKPHHLSATSIPMKPSKSSSNAVTTKHRRKISLEIPKIYQSEGDTTSTTTTVDVQLEVSIAEASFESEDPIPDSGTCESSFQIGGEEEGNEGEDEEYLIPKGWIAIVCGLSAKDGSDELPPNFYAAPRDVYVPDLTAVCDVLLGKLGYGTCSETVSSQTPFVYVPRPLFVEEFGLKRLMEASGTAVPMTRADFEAGNWAKLIGQAYELGKEKRRKHVVGHGERVGKQGVQEEESAACVIAKEVEKFMQEEIMHV